MNISPIGILKTPFFDKFTIPRQPGIVKSAIGELYLNKSISIDALVGIEQFSHLWIIWGFHKHIAHSKADMVRPPRLGGNKKQGVFATRSSFRVNNLALSVCPIISINLKNKIVYLEGIDCLNGTPVYDIKPYLPYSDCIKNANSLFAPEHPKPIYQVCFTDKAKQQLNLLSNELKDSIYLLLIDLLRYDVRPAYKNKDSKKIYASTLYGKNIKWYYHNRNAMICDIN